MKDIKEEIIRLASRNVNPLKIEILLGMEPGTIYKSKLYHNALMTGYQGYFENRASREKKRYAIRLRGDK